MELKGKYGTATVFTDEIESSAISQIIQLLNQPMSKDAHVRVMPDVHAGAGCVIGYTAYRTDEIVPNLIGVDIGCSVTAWRLGKRSIVGEKFDKLDEFIRKNIPSSRNIHDRIFDYTKNSTLAFSFPLKSKENIIEVSKRTNQDPDYVLRSLGTLGGGNHFIEIDKDDNDELWLVIHSGSRNFGLKIAKYHQSIAEDSILGIDEDEYAKRIEHIKSTKKGKGIEVAIKKFRKEISKRGKVTGLESLSGENAQAYFKDMNTAQAYAKLNHRIMSYIILTGFYKMVYKDVEIIESVHNYINFEDNIVRKGAISAHKDERVIIPLNMADGVIVGYGKGNEDWNYSAPHGAGRKMSRTKAKESISLKQFRATMKRKGVWSSTVNKYTLDEAPQAYKKTEHIIKYLKDTVDIEVHMKPIYNFKGVN